MTMTITTTIPLGEVNIFCRRINHFDGIWYYLVAKMRIFQPAMSAFRSVIKKDPGCHVSTSPTSVPRWISGTITTTATWHRFCWRDCLGGSNGLPFGNKITKKYYRYPPMPGNFRKYGLSKGLPRDKDGYCNNPLKGSAFFCRLSLGGWAPQVLTTERRV